MIFMMQYSGPLRALCQSKKDGWRGEGLSSSIVLEFGQAFRGSHHNSLLAAAFISQVLALLTVSFPYTCKRDILLSSKAGTGSYSYWQLLTVTIHTYPHSPVEVLYIKMDSKSILTVIGRYRIERYLPYLP